MFKLCKVILHRTDNTTSPVIFKYKDNTISSEFLRRTASMHHIHILGVDEIVEGDLIFVDFNVKSTTKVVGVVGHVIETILGNVPARACKKIIASTDSSFNLPAISKSFIETYVDNWNDGNQITDVTVMYDTIYLNKRGWQPFPDEHCTKHESKLSLNIDNKNIVVLPHVEKVITMDNLPSLLQQYHDHCTLLNYITPMEWIERHMIL